MKQEYILYCQHTLQHSQKLDFYRIFKTQYTPSNCLDLTRNTSERRALIKLRISNHKLMIELGRYNQVPRENRTCPVCRSTQIEDETHFLFHCPKYTSLRNEFYNKIKSQLPNILFLPINELIIKLMNTSNYFVNIYFIKFISSCFDFRNNLLSV